MNERFRNIFVDSREKSSDAGGWLSGRLFAGASVRTIRIRLNFKLVSGQGPPCRWVRSRSPLVLPSTTIVDPEHTS